MLIYCLTENGETSEIYYSIPKFLILDKLVYKKVVESARQTPAQALPEPSRSYGQARYRDLF